LKSSTKARHIPTLDGLRAFAIAMVIGSHARLTDADWYRTLANGYVGVMIFFALSGYLITTHLIWEYDAAGRISIGDFYIRRAFRILPAAGVYLAVLAVLAAAGAIVCEWSSIRAALFFYANYVEHDWAVSHFWSLSVEEHFYLLWPALLIAFGVRRGWVTALVMVFAVFALRLGVDRLHLFRGVFTDIAHGNYHSDLIVDTLLWGCCLAFYLRRAAPAPSAIASTLIAAAAAFLLLAPPSIARFTLLRDVLPAILLGAVVTAPHAPIGRFLEFAPVRFIGRLSYSLYLWQQLFLAAPAPHLPLPVALAALFACAFLSYQFIERPAIRFGRNLVGGKTSAHDAASQPPSRL
jgi:peptidoglycan/LPS O-acetylase OafA/YrhL